jgi:CxxC motif-containing protein (DUF1111 family)
MLSDRKPYLRWGAMAGCVGLALIIAGLAQQPATEAPAGFNTPSFNGVMSKSNGIPEPKRDTFTFDQEVFEGDHDVPGGLGPVYNATSCVSCHQNPNSGGSSQITELRAGHNVNGQFVNPTVTINNGKNTITGRSLVNDRAICPQAQEQVPPTENIIALRATLNTLGDGFVEAIPDGTLKAIAARQPGQSGGAIHGEYIEVPLLEDAPNTRVGRFGWKDQDASLFSFISRAYLDEIGITNLFLQKDTTTVCKTTTDPEDVEDTVGMTGVEHFVQFVRGTMVPPRNLTLAVTNPALRGETLFTELGCSICHVASIVTAPAGTQLNAGYYPLTVPAALGNKIIHPYSDFLLHNVGTGDGIVQTTGHQETANELRTAPLWGLRTKSRYMHDLQSLSLENAIGRHKGEASKASQSFKDLSAGDQQDLLDFLNSL